MKNYVLLIGAAVAFWYFFMRKKAVVNNPVPASEADMKTAQVTALLAQDSGVS